MSDERAITGDELAVILRSIADNVDGLPSDRLSVDCSFRKDIVVDGVDDEGYVTHKDTGGRQYQFYIRITPGSRKVLARGLDGSAIEGDA